MTPEEEATLKEGLGKMSAWAREHPGTAGVPNSLAEGGPGDSDCMSTYLASVFHAAGQRCRFVAASERRPSGRVMGSGEAKYRSAIFVEVFHAQFGKTGAWIPVLPFNAFIFEGPEILKWERLIVHEV